MCSWERFGTFAREPERAKVGNDARITSGGVTYEVEPDLAGETVLLWWGLFDNQLFIECNENRYGPFEPIGGLSTHHRYRKFKKTKTEERAERITALAKQLDLPRAALEGSRDLIFAEDTSMPDQPASQPIIKPFDDPDPFREFTYPSVFAAKMAIADYLGQPLTKLHPEQKAFIDGLLAESLSKKKVIERGRQYFQPARYQQHLPLNELEEKEEYVN